MLCMTFCTFDKRFTVYDARKSKASKTNDIKTCWLLEHTFSCLVTLLEMTLRDSCPTIKFSILSPLMKRP